MYNRMLNVSRNRFAYFLWYKNKFWSSISAYSVAGFVITDMRATSFTSDVPFEYKHRHKTSVYFLSSSPYSTSVQWRHNKLRICHLIRLSSRWLWFCLIIPRAEHRHSILFLLLIFPFAVLGNQFPLCNYMNWSFQRR